MFLWCPLAGREGRTVLCADVDQALAGLQASQRFAAWEGRQGPTQAHHGGGVVLFWEGGTNIEREGQFNCTHMFNLLCVWAVTCAPGPPILFLMSPLRVRIQADLHWQQLCAWKTPPERENKANVYIWLGSNFELKNSNVFYTGLHGHNYAIWFLLVIYTNCKVLSDLWRNNIIHPPATSLGALLINTIIL